MSILTINKIKRNPRKNVHARLMPNFSNLDIKSPITIILVFTLMPPLTMAYACIILFTFAEEEASATPSLWAGQLSLNS
jgi:hypothetical protein